MNPFNLLLGLLKQLVKIRKKKFERLLNKKKYIETETDYLPKSNDN